MGPQPPDWISAVTAPLRDNPELELAARHELGDCAEGADPDQLAAVATLLAPALSLGALLLVALVPLTHRAERHWLARDELPKSSPENLGMGRLETEAARLVQTKIRKALTANE